ncbi:MAG: ATP-binding cassette domain-containing protein [Acidimicrobiia bacterium]|nr:ATP-binding cassette domain-containing protein [Acidimicrobiia bacterium]
MRPDPGTDGAQTVDDSERVVIEAKGLQTHFPVKTGVIASLLGAKPQVVRALDGVDLAVHEREVVGLVGESGCGKSTLGMTLVRLYEPTDGLISFLGEDVTRAKGGELKTYRRRVQVIFQDPYGSLNPRLTVGEIVAEPLRIHRQGNAHERAEGVAAALGRVRIPAAEYVDRYPHELSGGQRQRVAIARAIVVQPDFIVADEPVSMLDVSVRAGVLDLLEEFSDELGLAVLYVSHDVATVRYICDRVAVMYLGVFVEWGDTSSVTAQPAHPYTQKLMAAVPDADPASRRQRVELSGDVPSPIDIPSGCRFRTRCPHAMDICAEQTPEWREINPGQYVACHLY